MASVGISTYQTYLMKKGVSDYEKLIDITDFPNLGGDPEQIDVTTLSHGARVYIPGIQQQENMTFTANYTPENYAAMKGLQNVEAEYAVWFGADASGKPDGNQGKFAFKGLLSVYITGGGVNEAVKMSLSISPTTEVTAAN